MTTGKATEIVAKIVEMLTTMSSEDRQRIIGASMVLLGETLLTKLETESNEGDASTGGFPTRAKSWMNQNGLSSDELEQVFDLSDGAVTVIAAEVAGKNNAERSVNVYVLLGLAQMLSTGEPGFNDKAARALCETLGCYDYNNHSTYLKEKGNNFIGSKKAGWKLTAPGLKYGASLVKKMTAK